MRANPARPGGDSKGTRGWGGSHEIVSPAWSSVIVHEAPDKMPLNISRFPASPGVFQEEGDKGQEGDVVKRGTILPDKNFWVKISSRKGGLILGLSYRTHWGTPHQGNMTGYIRARLILACPKPRSLLDPKHRGPHREKNICRQNAPQWNSDVLR